MAKDRQHEEQGGCGASERHARDPGWRPRQQQAPLWLGREPLSLLGSSLRIRSHRLLKSRFDHLACVHGLNKSHTEV